MLTVTESAKEMLRTINRPENGVLRLEPVDEEKLGFTIGSAVPDDQVVEEGGNALLHVPAPVSEMLEGASLDRVDTPEGPRLALKR
ncbi:MAG TPA: hypothetical protein VFA92_00020 [Candidatus Binatia bacterium]|jgi:iron-sulfur cluster assembly protein|nr:hypothetical protein [Candidatus Binatia bacterium]